MHYSTEYGSDVLSLVAQLEDSLRLYVGPHREGLRKTTGWQCNAWPYLLCDLASHLQVHAHI